MEGLEIMNYLRFLQIPTINKIIPIHLITVGSNNQPYLNRPVGLPYHQIFIVTKGKGVFRIFGVGDVELVPGEAIIVLAGTSHEYFPLTKNGWELAYVGFDGQLANLILSQLNLNGEKKFTIQQYDIVWEHIEELWLIAKKNESTVQWQTSECLYSILLKIKRLSQSDVSLDNIDEGSQNEHIRKAAEYICTNYSKPITTAYLSNMIGYSPQHFTRLFKDLYKTTPHQYLSNIRLEKSKYILEKERTLQISEVADRVGLEENYFIRLFKNKYGITPGFYRKKLLLQ